MGSIWLLEHSEFVEAWPIEDSWSVEALASRRLFVCRSLNLDIDVANLLV
jgi:hypothetical protein